MITHLIKYGIAGILATLLDLAVYFAATRLFALGPSISVCIAWCCAVIFAYWCNRIYVFRSKGNVLHEAAKFFVMRLASGIFEVAFMYIFAEKLAFYDVYVKIIDNVLVIIMNYIFSRIVIFKERIHEQASRSCTGRDTRRRRHQER